MKFKVGDKVRVKKDLKAFVCFQNSVFVNREMIRYKGKLLTISRVEEIKGGYRLEEDDEHWFWTDEMLEPICNNKIVITTDGKTTTARLYDGKNVIKTATAKCCDEDTFDFNTGAKLAFDRLQEPEKPKYYTGKVVCVEEAEIGKCFTKGKFYEIKNGVICDDDGTMVEWERFKSVDELNKAFSSQFIELVED